ncbi:hypothetical protein D3C78_1955510 [compost metagenome]
MANHANELALLDVEIHVLEHGRLGLAVAPGVAFAQALDLQECMAHGVTPDS